MKAILRGLFYGVKGALDIEDAPLGNVGVTLGGADGNVIGMDFFRWLLKCPAKSDSQKR